MYWCYVLSQKHFFVSDVNQNFLEVKNLKNAIITIDGEISKEKGLEIIRKIISASKDDSVENIVLFISSMGGNVCALTPIEEAIKMSHKNIIAVGTMLVASCAASIFMMANTRILFPQTEFILHKTSFNKRIRNLSEEELKAQQEKGTKTLWSYVINNSDLTFEELSAKTDEKGDWILTDEELESFKIITLPYSTEKVKTLLWDGEFLK